MQKNVNAVKEELSKSTTIGLDSMFGYYFTKAQQQEVQDFLNVWVAETISSQNFGCESFTEKLNEEVRNRILGKLGVNLNTFLFFNSASGTVEITGETKDYGKRTFVINLQVDGYSMSKSDSAYGAIGKLEYHVKSASDISGIPTSGEGVIAYADMVKFSEQVKDIADQAIKGVYKATWGNDADKVAAMFVDTPMGKLVAGNFSDQVYTLLKTPTTSYLKKTSVHCPVDVYVYDWEGNLCGAIKDNVVDGRYLDVIMYVNGDEKYIELSDEDYYLKMVGNDSGTMKYDVQEYIQSNELVRTVSTKEIPLTEGKTYYSVVPQAQLSDQTLYAVKEDGQQYIPVTMDDYQEPIPYEEVKLVSEGNCGAEGSNVTYKYYSNGVLQILGNGAMEEYEKNEWSTKANVPWRYLSIRGVMVEEGVTHIGKYAFAGFNTIRMIELADSVESIGKYGFYKCENLTCFSMGEGLETIDKYTFSYCYNLEYCHVPDNNQSFVNRDQILYSKNYDTLFKYYKDGEESFSVPDGTQIIRADAFGDATSLKRVIFPNSLKTIEAEAFDGCSNLELVTIPENFSVIENRAFNKCPKLRSVGPVTGNYSIRIEQFKQGYKYDFSYMDSLFKVVIPEGPEESEQFDVGSCKNVEKLVIPQSMKNIGSLLNDNLKTIGGIGSGMDVEIKFGPAIPYRFFWLPYTKIEKS